MIKAREYQEEAIKAVESAYAKGITRPMISLPTGTGKTIIFANLIKRRPGNALVIAHRNELIVQAADKIKMIDPDADIGIIKAERNEVNHKITVASIQTISRDNRLNAVDPFFNTIIVDEAHHAAADTYKKTLEYMGCFHPISPPLLLGVTATPERCDSRGLGEIFQEIVYTRTIEDMLKEGYLVPPSGLRVQVQMNLSKIKTIAGDYSQAELAQALIDIEASENIADAIKKYADGRKALVFTPSVDFAYKVAESCRKAGILSEAIDAKTDEVRRAEVINNLAEGRISLIANCGVLTEGFDDPSIDCIVIARPTKSKPLYIQMIGRGLRLYQNKKDCLVIDICGVTGDHNLSTSNMLAMNGIGADRKRESIVSRDYPENGNGDKQITMGTVFKEEQLTAKAVDLFGRSKFNWLKVNANLHTLSILKDQIVVRKTFANDPKSWIVVMKGKDRPSEIIQKGLTFEYAQGVAEDEARVKVKESGAKNLVMKNAPWRNDPASAGQIAALEKMKIRFDPFITKGEASDLISKKVAKFRG